MSPEELRRQLYEWCSGNAACLHAADYYVALLQNPCYPPTKSARNRFYKEIIERYGPPRRCDVKALVAERLSGTPLEKHIDEIVELAEHVRKNMKITSRVAAAVATVIVAEWRACCVIRNAVAKLYGVSYNAVKMHMKLARWLYLKDIEWKRT